MQRSQQYFLTNEANSARLVTDRPSEKESAAGAIVRRSLHTTHTFSLYFFLPPYNFPGVTGKEVNIGHFRPAVGPPLLPPPDGISPFPPPLVPWAGDRQRHALSSENFFFFFSLVPSRRQHTPVQQWTYARGWGENWEWGNRGRDCV